MLDEDLARLYGVETKVLNQAVKRNPERFPADFMFRLESQEVRNRPVPRRLRGDPGADGARGRAGAADRIRGRGLTWR